MLYAVTPNGETIAYCRYPGADPVLLVHGFGSDGSATWEPTGWLRSPSDVGRGAVAVDLRGHGASSKPHHPAAYRPTVLAADLIAVLDAQQLDAVDLMGYSMGSQVCRAVARDTPERIHRLVLGGIGPVEQLGTWGSEAVREALLNGSDGPDEAATAILRTAAQAPGADREALAACAAGMASEELPVSPLPVPTLVAAGEADPVAQDAESFAHSLGAQFVAVAKRNHVTTLSSRAFKAAVLQFLSA